MDKTDIAAILNLPAQDRLRLLELIWESLAAEQSSLPMSDAHVAVLDQRLAQHGQDPDDILTVEQVFAEARRGR